MLPEYKIAQLTSRKWADFIYPLFRDNSESFDSLKARAMSCRELGIEIYPPKELRLRAFKDCDLDNVNVVFIAQGPNPEKGIAQGLSYSLPPGKMTPQMREIITALFHEYFYSDAEQKRIMSQPNVGDISHWSSQGVLMLNSALTVENGCADSHIEYWKPFMQDLIKKLSERNPDIIWVMLGDDVLRNYAECPLPKSIVLEFPDPRLGSGFFGSEIFLIINNLLKKQEKDDVIWFDHF